jgi:anti-anti-sigma factor
MDVAETRRGDFVILAPIGRLDTKTSPELEQRVLGLLGAGERRFVVDFGAVDFLSSAGLRVLLMLAKKLSGGDGWLALSALNDRVREVFDIAGFTSVFTIKASVDEAVASAPAPGRAGAEAAQDAAEALGLPKAPTPPPVPDLETEKLARRAAALLGATVPEEPAQG